MNIASLLPLSPFLAVLYVAFALIQSLRKKQQGIFASLLAFIALVVPFAALMLSGNTTVQATIANYLTLNAVIVFVASIIILLIERGNKSKAPNRSYGMLGIGVGVLLAVQIFVYPLLTGTSTGAATTATTSPFAARGDTSTLQNVAAIGAAAEESAFAGVVSEQTGLTVEEITTELTTGSTIAELVAANGGDVDAVIQSAVTAIDDLKSQEGMPAQMLSNLGDTTTAATQFVQGELEQRPQQLLTAVLLGGEMPVRPDGAAGGGFPPGGAGVPPSGQNAPADAVGQGAGQVASQPTAQPTTSPATPTESVIRPTVISFPSATPTPVTQVVSAEATAEAIDTLATCDISIIYNLNLRDQPSTDSTIYLSIPFGTTVVSDGRTADNWYRVSYDSQTGWVSGEFVSAGASCAAIAIVDAD